MILPQVHRPLRAFGWQGRGEVSDLGCFMSGDTRAQGGWAQWENGGGIHGQTMLVSPYGLRAAADIQTGETLCCTSGGPVTVVTRRETQMAVSIRIAPQALGNRRELRVAGGQGVLIESAYAARITGSGRVVVPALALRQWRGISVSSARADGLCFTLSRPALVLGASGVLIAMDGPANGPLSTANLPPVPSLSLPSAQQLIACLIAYEAGALLRPQAAAF